MESQALNTLPLPPSTLTSLSAAGYEYVSDLRNVPLNELSKDFGIPNSMLNALGLSQAPATSVPAGSQSVHTMTQRRNTSNIISTLSAPLDRLLSGGLPFGTALELSGPPGTPKEALALNICRSFVRSGKNVLFVDLQNMHNPKHIAETLKTSGDDRLDSVSYFKAHTLAELMLFMHNLSSFLSQKPQIGLLVISSISFPFQNSSTSIKTKSSLQDTLRNLLTKACVTHNISVVTTSQLSTSMLNADGSKGTFNTAAKGVMLPPLTTYLPAKKSYRVVISRETASSGRLRLISSPDNVSRTTSESYTFENLFVH